MSTLTVGTATGSDAAEWDCYVAMHPDASIFHRFVWRSVLAEGLGYRPEYLMARRGDRICAVLPLMRVRSRWHGTTLVSLPFCAVGGPLADDAEALLAVDRQAQTLAQECGAKSVEYRFEGSSPLPAPTQNLYQTFIKAVPDHIEELAAVPQKRRSLLRKAMAAGLHVEIGRDVDAFFELYADNAHAHGTPALPRRFFQLLLDALGDDADILLVRDARGQAVSGMLNYHFRDRLMAYFAGENRDARASYANDYKCWQLQIHARRSGHRLMDYGRSKTGTGSMEFKKLWGFDAVPLAYAFRLFGLTEIPQNNPMNPKYQLAIRVWRKLPRAVVDVVGPRVIHGFG